MGSNKSLLGENPGSAQRKSTGNLMSHSSCISMIRTSVLLARLEKSPWLRVAVIDDTGSSAWSNPIWK